VPHPALHIRAVPGKGRAVFTEKALKEGTLLEEAPVIVMTAGDRAHLDKTLLHDYIFEWNPEDTPGCCMALGWIPLFNHSYRSNCEYCMNYEEETMKVVAIRDIAAGEEITINYNGDWDDASPVWFEMMNDE
jgi:hypothetical protein